MTRNEGEYVTRAQAARLLGVNVRTVDRYADQGMLHKYIRLTRILYLRKEVEELAAPVLLDAPIHLKQKRRERRVNCNISAALALVLAVPVAEGAHQLVSMVARVVS